MVCDGGGLGLLRALTVLLGARAGAGVSGVAVASRMGTLAPKWFFRIFGNMDKHS